MGTNASGEPYPAQYRPPDLSDPAPWDVLDVPLSGLAPRKRYHPEDRCVAVAAWRRVERWNAASPEVVRVLETMRRCEPDIFGCTAKLPLSEPVFKARLRPLNIGSYSLAEVGITSTVLPYLLCSLGEPHTGGGCYKLVAMVLFAG